MRKIGGLSCDSAEARSLKEFSRSPEESECWPAHRNPSPRVNALEEAEIQAVAMVAREPKKTAVRDLVSADGAKGFPRTIRYDGTHGEGLSSNEGFPRSCARCGGVGRFGDSPDVRRVPSGPRRLRHGFAWFSASCRTMTRQGPVQPRGHVPLRQGRCGGDAEAAKRCRRAAEQGDADAQYNLGYMCILGMGVPRNYLRAHVRINPAASLLAGEQREVAVELRDSIEKRLSNSAARNAWRKNGGRTPKTSDRRFPANGDPCGTNGFAGSPKLRKRPRRACPGAPQRTVFLSPEERSSFPRPVRAARPERRSRWRETSTGKSPTRLPNAART